MNYIRYTGLPVPVPGSTFIQLYSTPNRGFGPIHGLGGVGVQLYSSTRTGVRRHCNRDMFPTVAGPM